MIALTMATLLQMMLLTMLQMMLQTMVLMTMPGKTPAKWIESAMSPTQTQTCGVTTGATGEGSSTGRPHRLLLPTAVTRLYFLWWLLLMYVLWQLLGQLGGNSSSAT